MFICIQLWQHCLTLVAVIWTSFNCSFVFIIIYVHVAMEMILLAIDSIRPIERIIRQLWHQSDFGAGVTNSMFGWKECRREAVHTWLINWCWYSCGLTDGSIHRSVDAIDDAHHCHRLCHCSFLLLLFFFVVLVLIQSFERLLCQCVYISTFIQSWLSMFLPCCWVVANFFPSCALSLFTNTEFVCFNCMNWQPVQQFINNQSDSFVYHIVQ